MSFKDLYIAEVERLTAEYEFQGMDFNKAYDKASNEAYDSARDKLADQVDQLKTQRKERQ